MSYQYEPSILHLMQHYHLSAGAFIFLFLKELQRWGENEALQFEAPLVREDSMILSFQLLFLKDVRLKLIFLRRMHSRGCVRLFSKLSSCSHMFLASLLQPLMRPHLILEKF